MTTPGRLADRGRLAEALAACLLLDDAPEHWLTEGTISARWGDEDAARTLLERASRGSGPVAVNALVGLAASYARTGQRMTAREQLTRARKLDRGDAVVRHLWGTLGDRGATTPLHAEVSSLFDDYAEFYDLHVVETLGYRGPEMVGAALRERSPGGGLGLVIDLGCGTGLCGPHVRSLCAALVGIDLSIEMVRKCTRTGVYDAVWQDDAVHALRTFGTGSADAVVAGDVVGYIRDVEALFGEAFGALTDSGAMVLCVEAWDGAGDVKMGAGRRIAFSEVYLREAARDAGFRDMTVTRTPIRRESGEPVDGLIITLSRGLTSASPRGAP